MTAEHGRRRLPLVVAPTFDDDLNTIGVPFAPIACFRVDDPRFHFDSSFVHPDAAEDFAALGRLVRALPGAPLAVFGHADPTGQDAYNKRLAGRRAEAVYAVLVRDVAAWERLFSGPFHGDDWTFKSVQIMLNALGFEHPIDGRTSSPTTRQAVTAFQEAHADELKIDGDCGPATRKVVFRGYMDFLCAVGPGDVFSLEPTDFLGKGSDPKLKGGVQACGELNPVLMFSGDEDRQFRDPARKQERDDANSPNRRVMIFLFRPGTEIAPAKWPCPTIDEGTSACEKRFWSDAKKRRAFQDERRTFKKNRDTFACRFYHGLAMRSPCERLVGANTVSLRLVDHLSFPVETRKVRVWVDGEAARPAETDGDGLVQTRMPDGAYAIETLEGQFAYFGEEYAFYKHDAVDEVTTVPKHPFTHDPGSKNDRASGSLDEIAEALEQAFADLDDGAPGGAPPSP